MLLSAVVWAQDVEVATTVAFTEGPTVDRAGNVYFTELKSQRILKLGVDGVLSTYREKSNVANGLLIDGQNRLVACEGAEWGLHGSKVKGIPRGGWIAQFESFALAETLLQAVVKRSGGHQGMRGTVAIPPLTPVGGTKRWNPRTSRVFPG